MSDLTFYKNRIKKFAYNNNLLSLFESEIDIATDLDTLTSINKKL